MTGSRKLKVVEQGTWTNNLNMQIAPVQVRWTRKQAVTVRHIRTLLGFVHPVSGVNICLCGFVMTLTMLMSQPYIKLFKIIDGGDLTKDA